MQSNDLVLVDRPTRGVVLLTLNRPDKLNALSKAVLVALDKCLTAAEDDPSVGCVVLTGAGRAFSAGADISEMLVRGVEAYADPERVQRWRQIERFRKPLIAAVNGVALGGGLELALLCDIVLASEAARFGTPEISIGGFPGDGGTQRLPRAVGKSFAMQMILTGAMVDAALAERKGLVSEVLPASHLMARAEEIANLIAAKSAAVTPYAKRAVRAAFEHPLQAGLEIEHRLAVEAFATLDRVEGLRAFVEKRPPRFSGR